MFKINEDYLKLPGSYLFSTIAKKVAAYQEANPEKQIIRLGIGDVGNIVLRDRQNLAQNGIIIVVLTLEKYSNQLLAGPDIVSRGFVYVRESEDLMEEAQRVVDEAVQGCLKRRVSDWGKIKNIIRDSLSDFLWKKMKRNPMILPIIMEV